jgi:hypothetical protein
MGIIHTTGVLKPVNDFSLTLHSPSLFQGIPCHDMLKDLETWCVRATRAVELLWVSNQFGSSVFDQVSWEQGYWPYNFFTSLSLRQLHDINNAKCARIFVSVTVCCVVGRSPGGRTALWGARGLSFAPALARNTPPREGKGWSFYFQRPANCRPLEQEIISQNDFKHGSKIVDILQQPLYAVYLCMLK